MSRSSILSRIQVAATVALATGLFMFDARAQDNSTRSSDTPAPILIGLDADLSSGSAIAGEAIRRGMMLAIKDINDTGGILGRPLDIVVRDHRGNPARGRDNVMELASIPNLVAIMGGLHTPVVLNELEVIHDKEVVFLLPWAAGTSLIDNNYVPNFVFRVSIRDQLAGEFLVKYAMGAGYEKLGLLLERTGWGQSNDKALTEALAKRGLKPAAVEWFGWGVQDLRPAIDALIAKGAQAIILVSNPAEGGVAVSGMTKLPQADRVPIISHWGITGGDFHSQYRHAINLVDLRVLQTFSFFAPPVSGRADLLWQKYKASFPETKDPSQILAPVGTAHAFDLVHILAKAIEKAGTADRPAVRDALETLDFHAGIMRNYAPPFTATDHDALDSDSFRILTFDDQGVLRPVEQ